MLKMDYTDRPEQQNYRQTSYNYAVENDCGLVLSENNNSNFFKEESEYMTCHSEYAVSLKPERSIDVVKSDCDQCFKCKQPNVTELPKGRKNRTYSCYSTITGSSLISDENDSFKKSARILNNRYLTILFIVLVLLILIFACSVIALFVKVNRLQNNLDTERLERKRESNMFCLPCNDLILGPMDEDNEHLRLFMKTDTNGIEKCCAKGANQTSLLIDLLFQRREKLNHAHDIIDSETSHCKCNTTKGQNSGVQGNSVKIAGHFLAGVQSSTNNGKPPYTVHNWTDVGPVAHSNGIKLQDSLIIINSSGLYFVYSQISFTNIYTGQSTTMKSQALYHYVYRWNVIYPNDGNELLLKSVRTQCWANNRVYGDYTSYTAGAFKFNAGDQLYVKVSKPDLISRDPLLSFFGVIKL